MYELGYDVTAMDAAMEMCRLAGVHTGLEILQMRYEDMEFDDVFDGISGLRRICPYSKRRDAGNFKENSSSLTRAGNPVPFRLSGQL